MAKKKDLSSKYRYQLVDIQKPGESLQDSFRRLAKQTDQRLVRLEQAEGKPGYQGIKSFAYAKIVADQRAIFGDKGLTRFNKASYYKKASDTQLKAGIRAMQRFLDSATSTPARIKSVYQRTLETIKEKYGIELTWQQLAEFFESGAMDKAKSKDLDSGQVLTMLAIRTSDDYIKSIAEKAKKHNESHKIMSKKEALDDAIGKISRKRKVTAQDLKDIKQWREAYDNPFMD